MNTATLDLSRLQTFPGLKAEAFQHPDDRKATQALERLPYFPQVLRAVYGGVFEKATRLDRLSSAVRLGPHQGRGVYRLLVRAAEILDLRVLPELYISGEFSINASAFGVSKYIISLHAPLVSMCTEAELLAIIGHELGHVKCAHQLNKTLAHLLANGGVQALGEVVPVIGSMAADGIAMALSSALSYWSRMAEFSCDRAALLVVQDPDVVLSALGKLTGWSSSALGSLNMQELGLQVAECEQEAVDVGEGWAKLMHLMDSQGHTHPMPIPRIKKILQWGASDHYRAIMAGDYIRGEATEARGAIEPATHVSDGRRCPEEACRAPVMGDQKFCSRCGTAVAPLT